MSSRRRRPPLSDCSNVPSPPPPASTPLSWKPPSSALPSHSPLLSSHNQEPRGQTTRVTGDRSPDRSTPEAMDVVPCVSTPQPSLPHSPKGSLVTYNRRKTGGVSSHLLTMSCPPQINRRKERRTEDSRIIRQVKRRFATSMFNEEDNMQASPKRMRRMSLPNMPKWLPSDFVSAQRSHFAEVDAFELSEEEGELSDDD